MKRHGAPVLSPPYTSVHKAFVQSHIFLAGKCHEKVTKVTNLLTFWVNLTNFGRVDERWGRTMCRAVIVACGGYSLALWKPAKLFPNIIVLFAVGIASSCHKLPESLGKQWPIDRTPRSGFYGNRMRLFYYNDPVSSVRICYRQAEGLKWRWRNHCAITVFPRLNVAI